MLCSLFALCLFVSAPAAHADEVVLYAAGSLHDALTAVAKDFTGRTGVQVRSAFGPSGLIREKIENGDKVGVFASADMGSPLKLRAEGKAASVAMFTRNRLCAFARPQVGLNSANFGQRLLDPDVKLGTSTPKADPGGDYTWAMFHLIDVKIPGAFATLNNKAQKIVAGTTATNPAAPDAIAAAFQSGQINVMIGYCSGADQRRKASPNIGIVDVPQAYETGPEYGLGLSRTDKPEAVALAFAILSPEGQATLARFGFAPVGAPAQP